MHSKRVGDIMIPIEQYPSVTPECSLRDALHRFQDSKYVLVSPDGRQSLPRVIMVIDAHHDLVGLVRRRDILRGLEPGFLRSDPQDSRYRIFAVDVDPNLSELSYDRLESRMLARADRPVRDVMLPVITALESDDHLFKVIDEMVDFNLSLLPVLDGGKVVGAVRSVDVLHQVSVVLARTDGEKMP